MDTYDVITQDILKVAEKRIDRDALVCEEDSRSLYYLNNDGMYL